MSGNPIYVTTSRKIKLGNLIPIVKKGKVKKRKKNSDICIRVNLFKIIVL